MNRPSRNDDTSDHPTWNQNPPALAADLTTCEDLNGMANARLYRKGSGNGVGGDSGLGTMDEMPVRETTVPPRGGRPVFSSSGQRSLALGSCPPSKEAVMPVPAVLSAPAPSPLGRRSKAALSWVAWILSVVATAILLNNISFPLSLSFFGSPDVRVPSDPSTIFGTAVRGHDAPAPSIIPGAHFASPISKRSACGTGTTSGSDYNTGWHVAGLAIILTVSSLACAFSMIMKKFPFFAIPANFFFAIRHFGTGVLIATAFVHLLPTAFISLGDPCLSGFWTDDYPAMPGAIALAGIFFVTVIEMVFSPHRHIHQQSPEAQQQLRRQRTASMHHHHHPAASNDSAVLDSDAEGEAEMEEIIPTPRPRATSSSGPVRDMGPLRGRSLSISRQLSRVGSRPTPVQPQPPKPAADAVVAAALADLEGGGGGARTKLTPEQQHKKDILQCMLLEMGILFHSVFIGMTLSVSTGKEFFILLIAIAFHQSFEGLALGARIAAIDWPDLTVQPWLMALAYGCTTPIGQAIGLGVHSLYDPNGEFGLVLVGTMNAISSGLLVFASLVELLSEDFLSDESWKILNGKRRIVACLLVLAGAFGMSLVGAWA